MVTGASIGVGIGALVVISLVVGFAWWLAAWARGSMKDARDHHVAAVTLEAGVEQRDDTIDALTGERDRADAARKKAEEAARRAIQRLAETGSADDLVDALNDELSALSELSDLPRATTARSGEDREGSRAVHGSADPAAGADDP